MPTALCHTACYLHPPHGEISWAKFGSPVRYKQKVSLIRVLIPFVIWLTDHLNQSSHHYLPQGTASNDTVPLWTWAKHDPITLIYLNLGLLLKSEPYDPITYVQPPSKWPSSPTIICHSLHYEDNDIQTAKVFEPLSSKTILLSQRLHSRFANSIFTP